MLGFKVFVSSIRNQRTCEWANIDNIELHAHVDIPKVKNWDCDYTKELNTKKAHFTIDERNFDMSRYVQRNNLKKLNSFTELSFDNFLNFSKDSISNSDLYYKNRLKDGESSSVLLDKRTGKLWVTIKYKD